MNTALIRQIANEIRTMPPERKFDMQTRWVCGTSVCAIGEHCLRNPDALLRLRGCGTSTTPSFGVYSGFIAIAFYLSIKPDDVAALFDASYLPAHAVNPEYVARRLKHFADTGTIL